MNYLMVLGSTILTAFTTALCKRYQALEGNDFEAGLKLNIFNGLFTAIIFFAFSGFRIEFSWFSLWMAFGLSVCGAAYLILGLYVLKEGGMALYSIFLMSGGMILPYVFGVIFLDEMLSVFRVLGLICIFVAIILTQKADQLVKKRTLLLCSVIFVLNGGVSILSKCHQIGTEFTTVSSTGFVMYTGVTKIFVCGTVLLFCKTERRCITFLHKETGWLVAGIAFISGIAYVLQLVGAKELPATVLYPIITGGSIIFTALIGRLFFKEKIKKTQIISIILCLGGTLFFL